MRKRIPKILITGGAGFIGSAFTRLLIRGGSLATGRKNSAFPVVVDNLTYAGDLQRLKEVEGRFKFYKADICDKNAVSAIFSRGRPDIVVHLAAESHVDRSIKDASIFIDTNIKGTQVLVDASRKYCVKRFIFISTDEVYGEIADGRFNESSPIRPNSPYAASKASADLLVQAYIRTYKFPAVIIRPSNSYGPWQYPEKLIPLAILRVLGGAKVPVYGKGKNVRQWLYVDDCARGILAVMNKGEIAKAYNLGGACESRNIDTVKMLLKALGVSPQRLEFVSDRPGHDIRYSLDSRRISGETGWRPDVDFTQGLKLTVDWSLRHRSWLESKLKDINKLYNK
ncbi:MAG: dTDP-glucose 4,6-dehydratase [Candidatus Omnitrophota bacterium]